MIELKENLEFLNSTASVRLASHGICLLEKDRHIL